MSRSTVFDLLLSFRILQPLAAAARRGSRDPGLPGGCPGGAGEWLFSNPGLYPAGLDHLIDHLCYCVGAQPRAGLDLMLELIEKGR